MSLYEILCIMVIGDVWGRETMKLLAELGSQIDKSSLIKILISKYKEKFTVGKWCVWSIVTVIEVSI